MEEGEDYKNYIKAQEDIASKELDNIKEVNQDWACQIGEESKSFNNKP